LIRVTRGPVIDPCDPRLVLIRVTRGPVIDPCDPRLVLIRVICGLELVIRGSATRKTKSREPFGSRLFPG
jgi:hypothetical protein